MAVIVELNVDMKSIGEVAARFGLPTHALRYWEAEGLLTPARAGDRRRYTDADLHRVAAIGDLEGGGHRLTVVVGERHRGTSSSSRHEFRGLRESAVQP